MPSQTLLGSAFVEPIRVMISSRCNDAFPASGGRPLSKIRLELKEMLKDLTVGGQQLFTVWINEKSPPIDYSASSVEVCVREATRADLVLVLYNGKSGNLCDGDVQGICHKELAAAFYGAPAKVRLIHLNHRREDITEPHDLRFQSYIERLNAFRGASVRTEDELKERVMETVVTAAFDLMRSGARDSRKGNYHLGEALDWSRLDSASRADRMAASIREGLLDKRDAVDLGPGIGLPVNGQQVLFVPHGAPGSLGDSEVYAMVGQPALRDHQHSAVLKRRGAAGPVHVIAVQKTVTEAQAKKMLGFPDATFVAPPFGIYVSDRIQKIQLIFLANCRDSTLLFQAVDRLTEWLRQSEEDIVLAERACDRAEIVHLLAEKANDDVRLRDEAVLRTDKVLPNGGPVVLVEPVSNGASNGAQGN